jgi:hypothetical protein
LSTLFSSNLKEFDRFCWHVALLQQRHALKAGCRCRFCLASAPHSTVSTWLARE